MVQAKLDLSRSMAEIDVDESKKKAKNKITSQMSLAVKGTDSPPGKMVSLDSPLGNFISLTV